MIEVHCLAKIACHSSELSFMYFNTSSMFSCYEGNYTNQKQ